MQQSRTARARPASSGLSAFRAAPVGAQRAARSCSSQDGFGSTERRRSRTYRAVGCTTAPVLKTSGVNRLYAGKSLCVGSPRASLRAGPGCPRRKRRPPPYHALRPATGRNRWQPVPYREGSNCSSRSGRRPAQARGRSRRRLPGTFTPEGAAASAMDAAAPGNVVYGWSVQGSPSQSFGCLTLPSPVPLGVS
jgi:hypothetical protein